ncbi:ComF family protein [Polynucleobacter sp. MWH-Svant-W18]|uniref:ComF family protein n=1 Tax=Polynucleobacter sp. MWH-Svant-W18 TaxID=1855909 RepID=UPI001BFD6D08|nr:ComF family protein [Polynucleobacter sp. MWH-Svant-W18]QWD78931.1 ComF family protein [Polynucleobacter sp. MWH-Svant-W18]
MGFLEKLLQAIGRYGIPSACIVCERYQCDTICTNCLESLANDALFNYVCCSQCGIALQASEIAKQKCDSCILNPPYFDASYCLDRYEGALQNALHQLKYQKRLAYAHGLANAWNKLLSEQLKMIDAQLLFPVPLSIQKLGARGFNQSWEIARKIECGQGLLKTPFVLKRHHHEFAQAGEKFSTRHLAIQNMFYLDPQYRQLLNGQSIVIFDDVMTTGATLNEIARLLKDNGASQVMNWVLLRTTRAPHV